MKERTFEDILYMIKRSCDKTFYKGTDYDGLKPEIVRCATNIYIEQMRQNGGRKMNREILFKAKRKDNGEWVEGYVVAYPSGKVEIHKISKELPDILLKCEIAPSTLCQYTGLTDKNDKKIWENGILRYSYDYDGSPFLKDGEEIKYRVGAVFWSEWRGSWAVCGRGNKKCTNNDVFKYNRNPNRTEVIGNIFDNPELLEVE